MADGVLEVVVSRINYWVYIALMMIGLYGIIIKNNIMKKIIGLSILQTAVSLFFVSTGAKKPWTPSAPSRCGKIDFLECL